MKKQSVWMLAAMTLSALVTSCSSDDAIVDVSSSDLVDVTYTVSTEALTRAAHDNDGDASKITRCICEVYIKGNDWETTSQWTTTADNAANSLPTNLFAEDTQTVDVSSKTASFTFKLPTNRQYTLLFWADAGETYYTADKLYAVTYSSSSGMDGSLTAGCNENYDAFYGHYDLDLGNATTAVSVTLTRAVAQLNVITTDWNERIGNTADGTESNLKNDHIQYELTPKYIDLSFADAIPSTFNCVDGSVSGTLIYHYVGELYKNVATKKDDQYLTTLFMMYFFVNTDQKISPSITVKDDKEDVREFTTTDTPLAINYRTNISGQLLTIDQPVSVSINPNFYTSEKSSTPTFVSE